MQAETAGERVRSVRHLLGLTQSDLATITGVSQSMISQVENGTRVPTHDFLASVSKGTSTPLAFFRIEMSDLPVGSIRYRRLASASASESKRVETLTAEAYRVLSKLASEAGIKAPPISYEDQRDLDSDQIEYLASRLRAELHISEDQPIRNLTRACERVMIGIVPLTFFDPATGEPEEAVGHFGNSLWRTDDEPALIGYFTGGSGDRQRFTVAHELGHLVLHRKRRVGTDSQAEQEANRFAGALLLPAVRAREILTEETTLRELATLKSRWGISIQALIMRGFHLGLISSHRRTSLFKQLSARGWRKNEPVVVHHEEPQLLRKLAEKNYGSGIDNTRLSEHLALGPIALRSMMPAPSKRENAYVSNVRPLQRRVDKPKSQSRPPRNVDEG